MTTDSNTTRDAEPALSGRVVVLTGATGAIGRATTALLREQGAVVAALGRNRDHLRLLEQVHGAHTWEADVREADRLRQVRDDIGARLGPAASVLTLAGGNGHPVSTIHESLDHWNDVIQDDLTSTFGTIHAFLPHLLTHASGTIVTMASVAGLRAGRSNAAYAAAKAGVVGLTRHLAAELAPHRIRVNCVAPGAVDNDRLTALPADQRALIDAAQPLGRIGTPTDVAHAAVHLAGPQSSYTSGAVLELGGPPR